MEPRPDGSRGGSADRSAPSGPSRRGRRARRAIWGALLLIVGTASLLLALRSPAPPPTSTPAGTPAPQTLEPAAQASTLAARTAGPRFREAAKAMDEHACARAQEALAPALADVDTADQIDGDPSDTARLLSGLYAHACEDVALAAERLRRPASGGLLDDWRLLLFAEAAHALGETDTADEALTTLVGEHGDSPLVERALVTAVEQARDARHPDRVLQWVGTSRTRDDLSPETVGRLEALAWEIALEIGNQGAQRAAARRLLAYGPVRADELGVLDLFRTPPAAETGTEAVVAWRAILEPADLERRAASLLDARRYGDALDALEAVRVSERGFDWRLLAARALTAERRGDQALALLSGIETNEPERQARLEWERARAARDLSSPLRSGARLSTAERRQMAEAAHQHWHRLVAGSIRSGSPSPLALAALRRLFADYADEERFEEAIEALRMLRHLDPDDTTGASYLWSKGWEQYRRRNDTGAIGYWSELLSVYGESKAARSSRYWTGRAFERLGNRERAISVLSEVAAVGSTDFYRKHALAHLQRLGVSEAAVTADAPPGADAAPGDPPGRQPWPEEPALSRARRLTDLGLHGLALAEVESVARRAEQAFTDGADGADGASVDPRAVEALTGLALSRMGKRRASIPHLRRAFPVLGGPYQEAAPTEVQRLYYPLDFGPAVEAASRESGVPRHLVLGMIREESAFDVTALSHVGARGLMQLMPATGREVARSLGLPFSTARLDDPAYNVRLGTTYFSRVWKMFGGNTELALAGYNGGPYRLKRLWHRAGPGAEIDFFTETLPLEESKGYLKRVILFANSYEELYPE